MTRLAATWSFAGSTTGLIAHLRSSSYVRSSTSWRDSANRTLQQTVAAIRQNEEGPYAMSTPPTVAKVHPDLAGAGVADDTAAALDEATEQRLEEIEMIGEEDAAGLRPDGHSEISANMRFLHASGRRPRFRRVGAALVPRPARQECLAYPSGLPASSTSRTIHQLVTDRNRAVGLYMAVASLMWTASSAILNVKTDLNLMVPVPLIQYWCLPVTFGSLTVLALFTGFLLIRTRIGLIYEVAKMNVLLGLPVGRVTRIQPLSIFFLMHVLVSLAGGASALLLTYQLAYAGAGSEARTFFLAFGVGATVFVVLVAVFVVTVLGTTSDKRLTDSQKK